MTRLKGSKNKNIEEPKKLTNPEKIVDKPTDSKEVANHEEDVDTNTVKRMTDLPGIGPKTAEKLRELGYTLVGMATGRADEIAAEMKVSFVVAKGWVQAAQEAILKDMKMKTAIEHDKNKKIKQQFIKTGSEVFNKLIGGGFPTGATTGLSGRFSTGKTQACFDAVVDCIGRLKRKVVYIETEPNTFSLDRLKQIAKGRGLECDWDKLYICEAEQIPTAKAQFLQYKLVQKSLEAGDDIGLVIVDSFTAKFRPGYSRREMLPVRTREFTEHFLLIDYLAAKYNVAWVLTCQVIGAPDPGQSLGIKMKTGDSFYPVGGEFLLHSVNTWVSLQQIKTELYEAILYDSSYLERAKCEFMLTAKGLMDGIK
jgi:DNA repair protein RadA